MAGFEFLSHDHALLASQVKHVVALLESCRDVSEESLKLEIIWQLDVLNDQLVEHFDYEENKMFPVLREQLPEHGPQFETLKAEHKEILLALHRLQSVLVGTETQCPVDPPVLQVRSLADCFDRHAESERGLLERLAIPQPDK